VPKAVPAQQQVVEHGAALKELDVLKGSRYAAVHHPVPGQAGDVLPLEDDPAVAGVEHPGDHVEHRSFTRTIGTNDGKHLALIDREAQRANGLYPTKAQGQVRDSKHAHL